MYARHDLCDAKITEWSKIETNHAIDPPKEKKISIGIVNHNNRPLTLLNFFETFLCSFCILFLALS